MKYYSINEINQHKNKNNCWIILHGNVYNVTMFLNKHPGGENIIFKYAGKDASQAFDDIKHSKTAIQLLDPYFIGLVEGKNDKYIFNNTKKKWKVLFSKEDKIFKVKHIHKILGLYSLLHYLFRFGLFVKLNVQRKEVNLFKDNYRSLILVWIHGLLSFSSLIFKQVPNKQTNKPMIWKEFRFHNILFATRSLISFSIAWYVQKHNLNSSYQTIFNSLVIIATLILADVITKKFKTIKKESTTNTMPYWDNCPYWLEKCLKYYYVLAQFQATISNLGRESSFSVMFPIQFASFLMTLTRKGIIQSKTYHILYLFSLMLPNILYLTAIKYDNLIHINILISSILSFLRIRFRVNKYALWLPFLLLVNTKNIKLSFFSFLVCLMIFKRSPKRNVDFFHHRNQKKNIILVDKKIKNDLVLLTFKLTGKFEKNGLQAGQHISCFLPNKNPVVTWNHKENLETEKTISRNYTPIDVKNNQLTLLLKRYLPNKDFPDGGKFSQKISELTMGDKLVVSGPLGNNIYLGKNIFLIDNEKYYFKQINIICGGTGITPFLSIIESILHNPEDNTKIKMLCVNKTKKDIIKYQKLQRYSKQFSNQINIYYTLTREKNKHSFLKGRPNIQMIKNCLFLDVEKTGVLICGPYLMQDSISKLFSSLNFKSCQIIKF